MRRSHITSGNLEKLGDQHSLYSISTQIGKIMRNPNHPRGECIHGYQSTNILHNKYPPNTSYNVMFYLDFLIGNINICHFMVAMLLGRTAVP